MKIFYLMTGTGSLLIMTSYPSLDDPVFLQKMSAKGIEKFLAYSVPVELAKQWYGNHFGIVAQDLRPNGDLRVLDYNGNRVFERLSFEEIGHPHVYDKNAAVAGKGRLEIHPPIGSVSSRS
jgi:hypothetical protein